MKRPAQLRTYATFQEQVTQRTAAGGAGVKTNAVAQVWCHAMPASSREIYLNEQLRTEIDLVLVTRAHPAIKSDQQVVLRDGRVFVVLSVERSDAEPGWIKVFVRQYREETQTP